MKEIGRSGIEAYLKKRVAESGGVCRKFASRIHNPDQLVIWMGFPQGRLAVIHFVETKAPGKRPRPGQEREHKRLRAMGCKVFVIDTKEKVDAYVCMWGRL